MPKFSIILVSRNREEMLGNLLRSIFGTSHFDNEVIVGCDLDGDPYTKLWCEYKDSPVRFLLSPRPDNLHTYINDLAKLARGDYLFVLNDDCELSTYDWDFHANRVLGDFSYGKTHDDSIDRVNTNYAAFPIVSRKCYEKLGFLMDETYGNHGSDVVTWRIYQQAGLVVDLPMVGIRHVYHNSQAALSQRQQDKTATDMIGRTFSAGFDVGQLFSCDVSDKVKKLCS